MGYALATAAANRGWSVEMVSGPVSLPDPAGVNVTRVVTGEEMYQGIDSRFDKCDILIMTAAIIDYRPRKVADHKIKKFELEMVVEMEPVIDVLATVARRKAHQTVVGFAAETDNLERYANDKLRKKNADFIVANQIGGPESAFERDDNTVFVYSKTGEPVQFGPLPKTDLAGLLLDLFARSLPGAGD